MQDQSNSDGTAGGRDGEDSKTDPAASDGPREARKKQTVSAEDDEGKQSSTRKNRK